MINFAAVKRYKSQKTPLKEIKKAEAIKKEYFKSKEAR